MGIDLAPLDSVSGRLSVMASDRLVFQVSAGHLEESEEEFPEPRADVERFTASATYHRPIGGGLSATTFAYGLNAENEIIPGDRGLGSSLMRRCSKAA